MCASAPWMRGSGRGVERWKGGGGEGDGGAEAGLVIVVIAVVGRCLHSAGCLGSRE